MRLSRALFFLLVTACAQACTSSVSDGGEGGQGGAEGGAPPASTCDAPSGAGTFEIGTGEACFERLEEGAPITHFSGPQGGYHLFVALGCADCPDQVRVRYAVLDPATMEIYERTNASDTVVDLVDHDGWPQRAGLQLLMPGLSWDPEYDPPLEEGTPLVLSVSALDASTGDVLHEATLPVVRGPTVDWDPCDQNPDDPCCTDPCF